MMREKEWEVSTGWAFYDYAKTIAAMLGVSPYAEEHSRPQPLVYVLNSETPEGNKKGGVQTVAIPAAPQLNIRSKVIGYLKGFKDEGDSEWRTIDNTQYVVLHNNMLYLGKYDPLQRIMYLLGVISDYISDYDDIVLYGAIAQEAIYPFLSHHKGHNEWVQLYWAHQKMRALILGVLKEAIRRRDKDKELKSDKKSWNAIIADIMNEHPQDLECMTCGQARMIVVMISVILEMYEALKMKKQRMIKMMEEILDFKTLLIGEKDKDGGFLEAIINAYDLEMPLWQYLRCAAVDALRTRHTLFANIGNNWERKKDIMKVLIGKMIYCFWWRSLHYSEFEVVTPRIINQELYDILHYDYEGRRRLIDIFCEAIETDDWDMFYSIIKEQRGVKDMVEEDEYWEREED